MAPERRSTPWLEAGAAVLPLLQGAIVRGSASSRALAHAAEVATEVERRDRRNATRALDSLSQRELEVLRYLSAGHSNQEIATSLFLAVGTVKKHTHSIYRKLGVKNRTQAAQKAQQQILA